MIADPAVGTGTFILGILRHISATIEADQGQGAVPQAIEAAIGRLVAFELQLGPIAESRKQANEFKRKEPIAPGFDVAVKNELNDMLECETRENAVRQAWPSGRNN